VTICSRIWKISKSDLALSCLSVHLSAWNNPTPTGWIFMKSVFQKPLEKIQASLKSDENNGYFMWTPVAFQIISHTVLLGMRKVSEKNCRENHNRHFTFSNFFRQPCHLWDNVDIYCILGQATDGSVVCVHCMLDTWGYKTYTHDM
jgi:hypothetical protein